MPTFNMIHGDCLDEMKKLADCSVDSVVTDPPYGLKFMGKAWDHSVPSVDVWRECLRVLKPGGHILAFAGTRTQHRMACAIEDAGFEIRDMIAWVYGSGFPKSLDVSKAIDKAAGADREVVGFDRACRLAVNRNMNDDKWQKIGQQGVAITAPATDAAHQWQGWGTALKPALEPITVARKPFKGTVAANVLEHGIGALNIDGCRIETEKGRRLTGGNRADKEIGGTGNSLHFGLRQASTTDAGRWPANLIHDGSDEVTQLFPYTTSGKPSGIRGASKHNVAYADVAIGSELTGFGDRGSAARFFYCAKASKRDRDDGCESNNHPTVKPTDLMRYLVRLVTPPNGLVLDPFAGTGSTGRGAMLESMRFIGIEKDEAYVKIANKRIQVLLGDLFNADT